MVPRGMAIAFTYRKKFWMTKPLLPGTTPPLQLSNPSARIECACAADSVQPQPMLFTFLIDVLFSYFEDFSEVAHKISVIFNRSAFS